MGHSQFCVFDTNWGNINSQKIDVRPAASFGKIFVVDTSRHESESINTNLFVGFLSKNWKILLGLEILFTLKSKQI